MRSQFELVVVFKKNVSQEDAEKLMQSFNFPYQEGMDSSKGKIYFLSTGPKYIIVFKDEDQKHSFKIKNYVFLPEIHQIYEPDWEQQKD